MHIPINIQRDGRGLARMQSAYKRGRTRRGNRQNFDTFALEQLNGNLAERLSFPFSHLYASTSHTKWPERALS